MAGEMTGVTGQNYAGVSSYASGLVYRAFGGLKQMNYGNSRSLALSYNNRMFMTQWSISNVMRWNYAYNYFNEYSGRVVYAQNVDDPTLDRSYDYDHVGRPTHFTSGSNARHHTGQGGTATNDGPYSHGYTFDVWGNRTHFEGWGGIGRVETATYTNNKRNGFTYDAAGNLTNDLGQTFTYDATGQQASASYSGYSLQQTYDGDRLRVKKVENGTTTYYLRSTVFGGQIVAEINSAGAMTRGFVYQGSRLLAVQQNNQVSWVHEDPVAKSKRVTNSAGTVVSTIELDPWGGDTTRSTNEAFQPRRFTTYDRDGNASDEAMHRRYNRWHSRFDQPDPYDGSYDMTNPQSFNRYSYVQNDPVNFVDPFGLDGVLGALLGEVAGAGPPPSTVTIIGSNDFEIETGPPSPSFGGPTGGPNLEPQDPMGREPVGQERNDCLVFAGVVDILAEEATTDTEFIAKLYQKFRDRNLSYLSKGFREQFVDTGSSPNQARHAAGAIVAGYAGGVAALAGGPATYPVALRATLSAFNDREYEYDSFTVTGAIAPGIPSIGHVRVPAKDSHADIALNGVAVPMGFALGVAEIQRDQIGSFIRSVICNPVPK